MGLDVYLYARAEVEQNARHDEALRELYDEDGDYTATALGMTEAQRTERYRELNAAHPYARAQDVDSRDLDGPQLCNRRYLRSSYNPGGFDSAAPRLAGDERATFYWIFEPVFLQAGHGPDEGDVKLDETFLPALRAAAERAREVEGWLAKSDGLNATEVGGLSNTKFNSGDEVLEWYRGERARDVQGGYSNASGTVYGEEYALTVLAAALGRNVLGKSCAYLVYQGGPDFLKSYADSAHLAGEFAEEAVELVQRDGLAEMHWSG